MLRTSALLLGLLIAVAPASAGTEQLTEGLLPRPLAVKPDRITWPAVDYVHVPVTKVHLAVKFMDNVKARPMVDGSVASVTADMSEIDRIIEQHGVKFVSIFDDPKNTPERVAASVGKAESLSGHQLADLYGMMYVEGPQPVLEQVGNELLKLDIVEYAYFKTPYRLHQFAPQACCLPSNVCADLQPAACIDAGGTPQGSGSNCTADGPCGGCCINLTCFDNFQETFCEGTNNGAWLGSFVICTGMNDCDATEECGGLATGDCFVSGGNDSDFCDDMECCEQIGEIRPACIGDDEDEPYFFGWDPICAYLANLLCGPGDFCAIPFSSRSRDCFTAHGAEGCANGPCCEAVSAVSPYCSDPDINPGWNQGCADLAATLCTTLLDGGNTSPLFTGLQGYRTIEPYTHPFFPSYYGPDPLDVPADLLYPAPNLFGYGGHGLDLIDPRMDTDPANADTHAGLHGLGRLLKDVYGIGRKNGARGRSIRVGVIEWAAYIDHEDLAVTLDPDIDSNDQLILDRGITAPQHATACLGIIGARDNGRGVTGIAPDCDLWFFPLTTVLQPGRGLDDCVISALNYFEPGDVLSCSFGPGAPWYNLANDPFDSLILRTAVAAGITVCVSAGNDAFNLDNADMPNGDMDITVVGACEPGAPFCRIGFSNYTEADVTTEFPVAAAGWGSHVTTTGGNGELWRVLDGNNDPIYQKDYTSLFNGTSAAAPQIAGLAACIQGLAKQIYGIPLPTLSPDEDDDDTRGLIHNVLFDQCLVDEESTPGFVDEDQAELGDNDWSSGPSRIMGFPAARSMGGAVLSGEWFSAAPLIDDIKILRGTHILGNDYSIKDSDNTYFVAESKYTLHGVGNNGSAGPGGQVTYYASGETVDIMIRGHSDTPVVNSLAVDWELRYPGQNSLLFVELYDWQANRWGFLEFAFLLPSDDPDDPDGGIIRFLAAGTQRYVQPGGANTVLIRLWTYGFGSGFDGLGGQAGGVPFNVLLDFVRLNVSQDFGQFIGNP